MSLKLLQSSLFRSVT